MPRIPTTQNPNEGWDAITRILGTPGIQSVDYKGKTYQLDPVKVKAAQDIVSEAKTAIDIFKNILKAKSTKANKPAAPTPPQTEDMGLMDRMKANRDYEQQMIDQLGTENRGY